DDAVRLGDREWVAARGLLRDPDRTLQLEEILLPGLRGQREDALPAVDTLVLRIGQGRYLGERLGAVGNGPLQVGRLSAWRADLEVDPAGYPFDQVPPLREDLDLELLLDERDRPADDVALAAVANRDGQSGVGRLLPRPGREQVLRQLEADVVDRLRPSRVRGVGHDLELDIAGDEQVPRAVVERRDHVGRGVRHRPAFRP